MASKQPTDDLRIREIREVVSPWQLLAELPVTTKAATTTASTRRDIHRVLTGQDDRLLVVSGPCSIHDPEAAVEYAGRLRDIRESLADDLLLVMRVYFEKPRTTVGWKGLINDPNLDESFEINKGLRVARQLLLDLNNMGIPAGTEFLDLITPQYVADLIAWGAIGARTTESQLHREIASGLSCPVGFKNGTAGTLKIAVDAIAAARHQHQFLSMTKEGRSAIFCTAGNDDCHIILRGGIEPNFDAKHVQQASTMLGQAGLSERVMIDLSHANSRKQHALQLEVGDDVAKQIAGGDRRIVGVMIESHLVAGRQDPTPDTPLTYGQSITDACIDWAQTEALLANLAAGVRSRRDRHQTRESA
ncbi:MAG: 3-deoxy-7-phosphoheptulonate synthase [Pseudomonadota bacterium]